MTSPQFWVSPTTGPCSRSVPRWTSPHADSSHTHHSFAWRHPTVDCSPRGDEPGFVRVLSPQRLAIPDRTGNNLAQSFRNLWKNDAIGLLFLVPGMRESLRVNGTGYITDDEGVRRRLSGEGRPPRLAVIVDVHEVYFHCGKAIVRSRLWDPEANALADGVGTRPSVFSMQKVDLGDETASSELSQELEGSYVTDL